jgi:copper chaperone CopZ
MTHTYQLSGLTCDGCTAKVTHLLSQVADIELVEINADRNEATIQMKKHIGTADLKAALASYPKYQIDEVVSQAAARATFKTSEADQTTSWLKTYKPILLIFGYITGATLLTADNLMDGIRYFMAGFFLVFSFFKLLNISAFADSYAMYDIVAKRFSAWGFIYPFVELAFGVAALVNFQPVVTNWLMLVVMTVSLVGVLESVLNKRKIRCACLGTVFNLPMSTVTIVEDSLMIVLSAAMLWLM